MPHERVLLRQLNIKNKEELARLKSIEAHDQTKKFMSGEMHTISQFGWFARGDRTHVTFALGGRKNYTGLHESGRLQGWVHIYKCVGKHERRIKKCGVINCKSFKKPVFEVSFAKYPGAKSGQVSSGVRQACQILGKAYGKDAVVVTAYTDHENKPSKRVLVAAGFVKKGEFRYSPKERVKNEAFVLNWKKLGEKR